MSERRFLALAAALIVIATFACGYRGIGNGFINFDDPDVVISNPRLDDPGPASLLAVLTEIRDHAYLPLYYVGLMPEAAIAGKDPAAFHLASLLWHAANGVLLMLLMMAISGRGFVALGTGLIFVVHPVAVESVAWASGRKDQVSLLLLLGGLLAWNAYLRRAGVGRLAVATLLCVAGCFAKGSVVIYPLLALAILVVAARGRALSPGLRALRAWVILSLPATGVTALHLYVARAEGATGAGATHGAAEGALLFVQALGLYGNHLLLPLDLSIHYDLGEAAWMSWATVSGLVVLAVLLAGPLLLWRTRYRYAGLALSWALVSLLPFNNVFPRTSVPVADRYLAVGLPAFALLCALLLDRSRRAWAWIGLGALVLGLGYLTHVRTGDFESGETVFRAAMESQPDDPLPPHMLAAALLERGEVEPAERRELVGEAIALMGKAVALSRDPVTEVRSRLPLATTLLGDGRYATALEEIDAISELVAVDPARFAALDLDLETVHFNRSQCLLGLGRILEGREILEEMLVREPGHRLVRFTLAGLDVRNGFETLTAARSDEIQDRSRHLINRGITAYGDLLREIGSGPPPRGEAPETRELRIRIHRELGQTLLQAGWRRNNLSEALSHAESLLRIDRDGAAGFLLRAEINEASGGSAARVGADFLAAYARDPDSVEILVLTARNRMLVGENKRAVKFLRKALLIDPDSAAARGLLADLFMSQARQHRGRGDVVEALRAATEALTLDPDLVAALVLCGEIHESRSEWKRALGVYERALELAPEDPAARRGKARFLQARGLSRLADLRRLVAALPPDEQAAAEQKLRDHVAADYRSALELAPGSEDVAIARAYVRDAEKAARQSTAGDLRERAHAALRTGRTQEALALLEQAVRVDGTNVEILAALGMVLEGLERRDEALAYFEKALAYDPEHLLSLYHRARLAYVKGDRAAAERAARRFLDLAAPHSDLLGEEIAAVKRLLELLGR